MKMQSVELQLLLGNFSGQEMPDILCISLYIVFMNSASF
jgi:hypothetical protein